MGRRFNTAGPCLPEVHYMIPALRRLPEAPRLVEQMGYFVVHAPRQTGKTTAIRALAEELTVSGRYAALAFTCETGRAAGDNYGGAQRGILTEVRRPGRQRPTRACSGRRSPRGRRPARDRWCCSSTRSTRCRARA